MIYLTNRLPNLGLPPRKLGVINLMKISAHTDNSNKYLYVCYYTPVPAPNPQNKMYMG